VPRPHYLVRCAAIVSSLLLLIGFVAYRAGAFVWSNQTHKEPVTSESRSVPGETAHDGSRTEGDAQPLQFKGDFSSRVPDPRYPIIMSGSKSPFVPLVTAPETSAPSQEAPVPGMMSGTKSAHYLILPPRQWTVIEPLFPTAERGSGTPNPSITPAKKFRTVP
jgi:hypothetical protein